MAPRRYDPRRCPIQCRQTGGERCCCIDRGKYEIAAQQLLDRIARNPGTDASRMLLASCYGHLGRAVDARGVWAELLKVNPDFSLMQRARVLPYKNPGDFQCIVEGLAKAGLP
jgi:adenylate cyclase